MRTAGIICCTVAISFASYAAADVSRTTANNGNLIMQDVPEIPADIVDSLNRYQNVRSASFRAWTKDSLGLYVSTRFGDVAQLHRVDMPGGTRHQLTFNKEPLGAISSQPHGSKLLVTRDSGGSEFTQIFLFDPISGQETLLSDGESRNGAALWDRDGRRVAYQSTRRNGAANDIWLMDPQNPEQAEIVLKSEDGSWWGPAEFSATGSRILASNYVSISDSRVHLVDLDSGENILLAGAGSPAAAPTIRLRSTMRRTDSGWLRAREAILKTWPGRRSSPAPTSKSLLVIFRGTYRVPKSATIGDASHLRSMKTVGRAFIFSTHEPVNIAKSTAFRLALRSA